MEVSVAAVINQIRQNITDRYKSGFPIIKELVQNADDAHAHRMDFVFSPGIPDALHPLLQGPALIVLNDGSFDEKNARAINSIGLSSKAGNPNAVGRYGLGLKSVFHLCEAFFFLSDGDPFLHIVNPWAEKVGPGQEVDQVHPEWNSINASDAKLILQNLESILKTYSRFLCIWIPLRRESHFDHGRHPIIREVPGEKWDEIEKIIRPVSLQSSGLENELGRLFPQLRDLENLRVLRLSEKKKVEIIIDLGLVTDSTRLAFPSKKIEPNTPRQFYGHLSLLSSDGKRAGIEYAGVENYLEGSIFESLLSSHLWPRHSNEASERYEVIEQRDNAQPHIAAVFLRFPATSKAGGLSISRAVYLPLERQSEAVKSDSSRGFGLTLHGWFFVDAGRTELHGWDKDYQLPLETGEDLTLSWNGALAQKGTLQAVIPALDHFATSLNLSYNEVLSITTALVNSELYKKYRAFVCETEQWVLSYYPNGSKWIRIPSSRPILELPKPPESDPERPSKVFPAILSKGPVTIEGMPRLSLDITPGPWPMKNLITMLSSVPVQEVFSSQVMLDYLVKSLEKALQDPDFKSVSDLELAEVLLNITHEAFATLDLKKLDENTSLVKKICGLLPSEFRFSIIGEDEDLRKPEALTLLKNLFQLQIKLLITPAKFDGSPAAGQHINISHATAILQTLANDSLSAETPGSDDFRSRVALQIFKSFQEPFPLINRCGNLRLFKGMKYVQGSARECILSFNELRNLNNAELLFYYSVEGARSERILRQISLATKDTQPVIITREMKDGLRLSAPESSPLGSLRLLESAPMLSQPAERRELVRELLAALDTSLDAAQREKLGKVLRYILHAQKNQFNNADFLYTQDEELKNSRIMAYIVLKHRQEEWRILDSKLGQVLTPDVRQKIQITELGDTSALSLLRSLHQDQLKNLDFAEIPVTDRNGIIIFLYQQHEYDLLKQLTIHETLSGRLVYITKITFLESNFAIPSELESDAILLRIPTEPLIKTIYTALDVPPLSAISTIRLAVTKDRPERYWRTIMDALFVSEHPVDSETLKLLQENFWIPTQKEGAISPTQILHLPGLDHEISRLLSETRSAFVSYPDLIPDFIDHSAWNMLFKLVIPDKRQVTRRLGEFVSESEKYRIGNVDKAYVNLLFLETFRFVFEQPHGFDIFPAANIIQEIDTTLGSEHAIEFLRILCRPVSSDRYITILEYISKIHENAPKDKKSPVASLFAYYLAAISAQTELKDAILPAIRLMNKNGNWKSANELVYNAKGIDSEDLLDEQQGKLLKLQSEVNVNKITSEGTIIDASLYEKDLRSGAKQLLAYFEEWEPYIQNKEVLGGFLSLLGDQPDIKRQAAEYLGKRDINETREILEWVTDAATFHAGENVGSRLQRQSFFIRIVESQTRKVSINSVTGKEFEALLQSESSIQHLLYDSKKGPIPPTVRGGKVYDFICLRKIRLDQAESERLIDLLKNTTKEILHDVYYQDIKNFNDFWHELEQTDQLDIEIAQDTIIETAFSYIPSLGLSTHESFRPRIKKWEDIRNREVQARQNARRKGIEVTHNFEKEREKLREELKTLLESTGPDGQKERKELLRAVRYKIGQEYQYKRASILFELFQNADDAVAELGVLLAEVPSRKFINNKPGIPNIDDSVLSTHHRRVVVDWDSNYIRLAHWGRSINQIHPGSGEVYGYGDDLVKMLMMQRSDKLIAANLNIKPLTGKFGLGFKSVFLVSEKPSILSGRIKFEISAGLYPLRMTVGNLDNISKILESWSDEKSQDGTLIELPMDFDGLPNLVTKDVVNDFYQWSDFMVVFSHEINRIELRQNGQVRRTIEWQPEKITGAPNWSIGKLHDFGSGGNSMPANVLVWKTSKQQLPDGNVDESSDKDFQGSFLIKLSQDGCVFIDPKVPRIWVTAPTEEVYPVGFLLNTNFALDVGRAQLARASDNNRLLARDLGKKFGKSLRTLYDYTHSNWNDFCNLAGLNHNLNEHDFWESVWRTSCEPMRLEDSHEGYELLRIFTDLGFGFLYRNDPTLPTGLPARHKVLTKTQDLHFFISGVLEKSDLFAQIADWPIFQKKVPVGSAISNSVRATLVRWSSEKLDLDEISLWKVVNWVVGPSDQVSPDQADILGRVITPTFINGLERAEEEVLRHFLKKLKFKSGTGKFSSVTDMLAINIENLQDYQDEFLRSQFAPAGLVLSGDEYKRNGTQFFRACREKLSAPVEKLVVWALEANDLSSQIAVLNYLLRGELADALTQALLSSTRKNDYDHSWFALISEQHELLQYFNSHDRNIILGRLCIDTETPEPPQRLLPPARVILDKIFSWWERNQSNLTVEYELSIYPYGKPLALSNALGYTDENDGRREWMILFLLGSYHTIGRVHKKAHRNFLEDCHEKGWLNTFSRSDADAYDWINVLESYLDNVTENDDAKYQYLFMRQFVQIYKLSRYLPDYVEVILGTDQINTRFNIDQITNPNKSELFSGSGLPLMPKLSNTLGIGIGLVLRELVRKDVITSHYVYEHCYSPVGRLRRLFAEMDTNLGDGDRLSDSTQIYKFLVKHLGEEKATFNKSFDIPFLALTDQYENLQAFLDDNQ